MTEQIEEAVKILNNHGVIIFPTDTAFGIGCRIDDEQSIKRLFEIRKRPASQATPVLVSSIEMAKKYLISVPDDVKEKLMDKYWPGPLTIILPCRSDLVPSLVRGGGETLGVRMPKDENILKIIEEIGVPLLGPSANFSNGRTPYEETDLDPEIVRLVDFVLAGETKDKNVSTVIDCSVNPWEILREGAISI
jgi:L-threonylcarbamoyladenylate synthase